MNELNFNDLQSILFGIMQTWQDNDILQKGSNEFCTSNLSRNYSGSNSVRKFMNELLMILIILIFLNITGIGLATFTVSPWIQYNFPMQDFKTTPEKIRSNSGLNRSMHDRRGGTCVYITAYLTEFNFCYASFIEIPTINLYYHRDFVFLLNSRCHLGPPP